MPGRLSGQFGFGAGHIRCFTNGGLMFFTIFRYNLRKEKGLHLRSRTSGIIFIDVLLSLVIVGIGVGSAILFMATTNNLAVANRNMYAAEALCQERIAQVVAASFAPPATVPSYFGTTWPVPTAETLTATETVQLYTDANGTNRVPAIRSTLVSLVDATTNLTRVTARVSYTYRGKNHVWETYTLRAPD